MRTRRYATDKIDGAFAAGIDRASLASIVKY
jgi:hypothetical protein